jgi:hypothetical protein
MPLALPMRWYEVYIWKVGGRGRVPLQAKSAKIAKTRYEKRYVRTFV